METELKKYNNYYCAICNGAAEDSVNPCTETGHSWQGTAFLRQLWNFRETQLESVLVDSQCSGQDNIYDPYTRQCRPLTCSPGFELDVEGKCVNISGGANAIDGLCCQQQDSLIFFGIDRPRSGTDEVNENDIACFLQELNISLHGNNTKWRKRHNFGLSASKELLQGDTCDMTRELDAIFLQTPDMFSLCKQDFVSYVYMCNAFPNNDGSCDGIWFQGKVTEFLSVDGSYLAQVFIYKGEYILPKIVLHQVYYSYDLVFKAFMKESTVAVCGEYVRLLRSDCPLITLEHDDYHTGRTENGTRILQIGNLTLYEDEYVIYPNGRAQVCANNLPPTQLFANGGYLDLANTIGSALSLVGLFMTFGLFCRFKDLRNLHGRCIMNLSVALFIAQLSFLLTSELTTIPQTACLIMACISHFTWLASFTWTTIIAINLLRVFSSTRVENEQRDGRQKSHYIVPACGWGIPLLIILACIGIDEADAFPIYSRISPCWMVNPTSNLLAFGVPVAVSQVINVILFVITVIVACRSQRRSRRLQRRNHNLTAFLRDFILCFKIGVLMGVSWSLGFAASFSNSDTLWWIFVVTNSLQGILLLVTNLCASNVQDNIRGRSRQIRQANGPG
ncbi:uncharacterized protein [Amphiura filiformis]|uniref:uncharacterized protein n=1 Tax=Amphiura filiformis TaxID=82378 RepID=UPI003B21410D